MRARMSAENQRWTLPVCLTRSASVQPGQVGTGVARSAFLTVATKRAVSAATAVGWSTAAGERS